MTAAESAWERRLSTAIMHGGERPETRTVSVQVDADPIAEVGPGAVLGGRAVLEGRAPATG